jgi:dihydroflavonol-4-reductase
MRRSLVTGGSGFIGRHLVEALLARGEEVRVLDIAEPPHGSKGVAFARGSVADRAAVESALKGIDCLYHLAGIAHFWRSDRDDFDRVNRRGAEIVLKAAAAMGVARVVHCSTESILLPRRRDGQVSIDESVPPGLEEMPGPYTRSKYLGEQAALEAAGNGLDVVVVNPTIPIGDGDHNMTPPAVMLDLFLSGRSPFYLDCILNLVDVRDLAEGIALAAERGRPGERYILGGENISLKALLPKLEQLSGRRMPRRTVPPLLALGVGTACGWIADRLTHAPPVATRESVIVALRSAPFDSRKAKRELGYAPRPIDEALTEVVEAFKRRGRGKRSSEQRGRMSAF